MEEVPVAMSTIRAIYENGVFRPIDPIDLPESSVVEFEPRPVGEGCQDKDLDAVYEVLSRRFRSGRHEPGRTPQRASAVKPVFLDTVGLISLWDEDDQWHDA